MLQGRSPFELLDHTEAELDFILEMFAQDNPDRGKFFRTGQEDPPSRAEVEAAWERVLVGRAHHEMMSKFLPEALREALRNFDRRSKPQFKMGPAATKKD